MNIETNVVIWQNSGPSGVYSVHVLNVDGTNTFTYNATSSEIFVQIRQAGTYYLDNIRMYRTYEDTVFVRGYEVDMAYRYGFNSMERDNEIKGKGNSYDFGARLYDPRVGRWLGIDPLARKYPNLSPYNFTGNNPILFVDYDGKDFGVLINHTDGTILIIANFYTINEKTTEEANKAAANWNALTGSTVLIGGKEFTVTVQVEVLMASGETDKERFKSAQEQSKSDLIGNTYNGDVMGIPNGPMHKLGFEVKKAATSEMQKSSKGFEVGWSDGKNITMPLWNMENTGPLYAPSEKTGIPYSVDHEIGHNYGLDDPGGKYYSPGGAMDYGGLFAPNQSDLENLIKYSLDGGKGAARVSITHQASKVEDYNQMKSEDVGQ